MYSGSVLGLVTSAVILYHPSKHLHEVHFSGHAEGNFLLLSLLPSTLLIMILYCFPIICLSIPFTSISPKKLARDESEEDPIPFFQD